MKLSEAILEGMAGMERVQFRFFKYDDEDRQVGCCAVGAACKTLFGKLPDVMNQGELIEMFQQRASLDLGQEITCPVRGTKHRLISVIIDLNDIFDWSREQIVKWLQDNNL